MSFLNEVKDYFKSSKKRKLLFLISLVVMCLGTVVFAKLTDDYLSKDDLYLIDKPITDFVVANRNPILNRLMVLVTLCGNWQLIITGTALASIVFDCFSQMEILLGSFNYRWSSRNIY